MKRTIIFTIVLVIIAALVGGFGYFQFFMKPEMIKGFMAAGAPPPATVSTELAKAEQWVTRIPAIGTLNAVQGVDVAAESGGVVRAIHFESGQDVEKGAKLVSIDDSVERSDLKAGLAQLAASDLDLKRKRELVSSGNISKTAFDTSLAARDTAAAMVERNRAVIAQKEVHAPFSGKLGIRKVDVGQYVSPGTPLVSLQNIDLVYVDFPVPEQNIDRVQPGQDVEVRADAWPGEVFIGKIQSTEAKVNQDTRNILVRAEIPNPERKLVPGMFANVGVLAGAPLDVVTVPRTAITYSLYGDNVYVVKEGVAERRFIRTGTTQGDRVVIIEGLAAGEEIVTAGQLKLMDKAPVTVDNSKPLEAPTERPKQ
ncbi:MAG TPA: efflux RND transporter periplasmic adaptor subunit [Alphaproteobacteria bacterium]